MNNPHQRKVQDVELAVKELIDKLHENNAKIQITKLNLKDPMIY